MRQNDLQRATNDRIGKHDKNLSCTHWRTASVDTREQSGDAVLSHSLDEARHVCLFTVLFLSFPFLEQHSNVRVKYHETDCECTFTSFEFTLA